MMLLAASLTANANLAARLPYLFATCRFAHYLKCMVRDQIGTFKERSDMEKYLNNWIAQYVEPDPARASDDLHDLHRFRIVSTK